MSQSMSQSMPQQPSPTFTLTGADVKRLRGIVGATQAELAHALHYKNANTISKWERLKAETSIPRAQYDAVLAFFRSHYDVAEGRRVQLVGLLLAGEQGVRAHQTPV